MPMITLGRRGRQAATVAGIAAAGLALSAGGAVAADLVTSADIKNQTIRSGDIGANEVGASELRPDAVRGKHLAPGSVGYYGQLNDFTRDKIEAMAAKGYETVVDGPQDVTGSGYAWATCPDGKTVIGGGYHLEDPADGVTVTGSFPADSAWMVQVDVPDGVDPGQVTVRAVCAVD
jgi:hypothetical protein